MKHLRLVITPIISILVFSCDRNSAVDTNEYVSDHSALSHSFIVSGKLYFPDHRDWWKESSLIANGFHPMVVGRPDFVWKDLIVEVGHDAVNLGTLTWNRKEVVFVFENSAGNKSIILCDSVMEDPVTKLKYLSLSSYSDDWIAKLPNEFWESDAGRHLK